MKQSFTSSQVSLRTGLSPRQLQWWDEQGIVTPSREGHRRLYSAEDLAELSLLGDLRRRGVSLQRIRRMIGLLRREFGRRLAELLGRGRDLHLLTDGDSVFLCDSERGVIDLLRNTQQPLLAICLGPLLERALAPKPEPAETVAMRPAQTKREQPKRSQPPKKRAQSAQARPTSNIQASGTQGGAQSLSRRRWR